MLAARLALALRFALVVSIACLASCHPEATPRPAPDARARPTLPSPRVDERGAVVTRSLVARSASGDLVVVDADTSIERARAPMAGYGGLVDFTYDAAARVLYTYEESDEGEGAELARYALAFDGAAVTLGPRVRLAWASGVARLVATGAGLLKVEDAMGLRWSLSRDDTPSGASVSCPRPASLSVFGTSDGARLVGVSSPYPERGPLQRVEVGVGPQGLGPCAVQALASAPASARLVRLDDGAEIVVGVREGKIEIARLDGPFAEPLGPMGLEATSVEVALALEGAPDVLAILSTGPARLTVVRVERTAAGLSVAARASVALAGTVRREEQFFSRELAVIDRRALVATSEGVVAFDVDVTGPALALAAAPFGDGMVNDLRGPLVAFCDPPRAPASERAARAVSSDPDPR